ncbi:lytic transglycosylase domain-containing protein [Myxococcus sp. AM010]|uniref:lytic transglycosylase domain-containing protein n=1 Tax=Myxococcus sp. AM010 TaxID=2745138 RepID=UPI0015950BDA|nr:lytic transglycosylase domain-containing protein [Myxococcus sp. AM010]NVJ15424.1 transglycosylase SLT domain-containing protein [Myxococcus sp. AM010]
MRLSPLSGSASSAVRSPAQDVSGSLPSASLSGASAQKPALGRLGMQQDGFDMGGGKAQSLGKLLEGAMAIISTLTQLQQAMQGGAAGGAQGAACGQGGAGAKGASGASPSQCFSDSSFSPASACGNRPPVELNPGAQGPSPFMSDPVDGLTSAPPAGGSAPAPVGGPAPAGGSAPVGGNGAAPAMSSTGATPSAPSVGASKGAGGASLGGNLPPALEKLRPALESAAAKTGVPVEMLAAQVWAESRGDVAATSTNGGNGLTDTGLMQVNPNTYKELQSKHPELQGKSLSDPETNILAGACYMKDMKEQFGSWDLALRAYNSGPNGVDKSNPHAIPAGTGDAKYVQKVNQFASTLASGQGALPA